MRSYRWAFPVACHEGPLWMENNIGHGSVLSPALTLTDLLSLQVTMVVCGRVMYLMGFMLSEQI